MINARLPVLRAFVLGPELCEARDFSVDEPLAHVRELDLADDVWQVGTWCD